MPTITDGPGDRIGARRLAGYCALVLVLWFGLLAGGTLAFEPTTSVMVVAPGGRAVLASATTSDVDLLEATGSLFTVAGRQAGFVRRLYAAGAWLVLPARTGGCRLITPVRAQIF